MVKPQSESLHPSLKQDAYKKEYERLARTQQHHDAFAPLINQLREDGDDELADTIFAMISDKPNDYVFNREKLEKLRQDDPELHSRFIEAVSPILRELAGT